MSVISVDSTNFQAEVLNCDKPVLVEFGVAWCGSCVRQLSIFEKFANDNAVRVKMCRVDVDNSAELASTFSIRGVPTIILFHQGKKIEMKTGIMSGNALNNLLLEKVGV